MSDPAVFPDPITKYLEVETVLGQPKCLYFRTGESDFLTDIASIEVVYNGNVSRTFYIDRIDANTKGWSFNQLSLEKMTITATRDIILTEAEFGEKFESLVDEIDDKVNPGDLAFDIYAKG